MKFLPPALLLLFAASFFGVWLIARARTHLLFFAIAFASCGLGLLAQIGHMPADTGINAVLSAMLYVAGALVFSEGVMRRSGRTLAFLFPITAFIAINLGIAFFFYGIRDLTIRVYILNLGFGGIILATAWKARFLARGSGVDRVLFWVLVLLGFHFFPRTILLARDFVPDAKAFAASPFWTNLQFMISLLGVGTGLALFAITCADVVMTLRDERDTDPLTGVLNRRALEERAARLFGPRREAGASVVLCDIDHFKAINDGYGHDAGDRVLAAIAATIKRNVRSSDLLARLGGEEFVIVLRDTPVARAAEFAERLRTEMRTIRVPDLNGLRPITCSFGIAALSPADTLADAIRRADQALYAAKRGGRDRVRQWSEITAAAGAA